MKGVIEANHIAVNKYEVSIAGLISITAVTVSGIEDELEITKLPDRTQASGGNRGSGEFEIGIPMHHAAERAAMEIWYREAQDPVLPTYKKPVTIVNRTIGLGGDVQWSLIGCFVRKRVLPELDMANEGEMAKVMYTIAYDDIEPI